VHAIYQVGRNGEPLEPTSGIATFNNTCGVVVKEKVFITYNHWEDVSDHLKTYVWEEVKRRFMYPEASMKT
jgi:hypothetical protein